MTPTGVAEATPIRHPEDLRLPFASSKQRRIKAVFEALTNEGTRVFISELLEALASSKAKNDLRPVQEVIEAWYRTLLFLSSEGFDETLEEASRLNPDNTKTYTADELAAELGL